MSAMRCPCFYPDPDPELSEDGIAICACGHVCEDEHDEDGQCQAMIPQDGLIVTSRDDEEEDDASIPKSALIGNRKHRRRHGARSTYAERLREMQKKRG